MAIQGLATLVSFLVFVAPGALWLWLADRRRATPKRDGLQASSLVVLASLVFSVPAAAAVLGLLWAADRDLSSLRPWLNSSLPRTPANAVGMLLLLLLQTMVSLGLAALAFRLVGSRVLGPGDVRPVSAWTEAFRLAVPAESAAVVSVALEDGSCVRGVVAAFSPDHEMADRELLLRAPIVVDTAPGATPTASPFLSPVRLVVPSASITSLSVLYVRHADLPVAEDS